MTNEQLGTLLNEQGMSAVEIAESVPVLAELWTWNAPTPTKDDTTALVNRLMPSMPTISPVRRMFRERRRSRRTEFMQLVQLAPSQVSILRPSFWLISAGLVLLGVLLVLNVGMSKTLVLLALGPLLGYLATVSAFRSTGLNVLEFELACPPSLRQLMIARLAVVLGYDVALGMGLSILLWAIAGDGILSVTFHWLAPLLFITGATLLLSLRITMNRAAAMVYASWLALLGLVWVAGGNTAQLAATFSFMLEAVLGVVGLVCLGLALRYARTAMPRLLPHRA